MRLFALRVVFDVLFVRVIVVGAVTGRLLVCLVIGAELIVVAAAAAAAG